MNIGIDHTLTTDNFFNKKNNRKFEIECVMCINIPDLHTLKKKKRHSSKSVLIENSMTNVLT